MQQWAAVKTKFLWITVPPHRLARSLPLVKNSSRTIQSHLSLTGSPLTTRRFLDLTIFEFSSMEQYWRSKKSVRLCVWKIRGRFFCSSYGFCSRFENLQPLAAEMENRFCSRGCRNKKWILQPRLQNVKDIFCSHRILLGFLIKDTLLIRVPLG